MKPFVKMLALGALVACLLVSNALAAKKYQVTGTIVALTDKIITVQKPNDEKWEIDRDDKTKIEGKIAVGEKVTIEYTMTAATVENKTDSK